MDGILALAFLCFGLFFVVACCICWERGKALRGIYCVCLALYCFVQYAGLINS